MPVLTTLGAATAKAWGFLQQVAAAADPYFNYVTMLLTGNGTNGAQNNTFLDSSSNAFSITRNGNTTQGSFSPYGSLWSNYFGGTNSYFTLSSNASMDFGTGAFTIEAWVFTGTKSVSVGASRTIIGNSGNSYTMQLYIDSSTGYLTFGNTGSTYIQGTSDIANNQWNHIVIVRSGTGSNQTALFVNGVRQAQSTNSQNYTSGTIYLGAFDTGNGFWNGYISNLRIVKGSAVYDPSVSTLTVPTTPLTAVTNTALLTCQSNRFLDASANAYTVTPVNSPSVQRFSPFNPTASYSTATIGGSGYFDGSGDTLTTPSNSALNLGSGDWTIDFWVYPTALVTVGTNMPTVFNYGGKSNNKFQIYPNLSNSNRLSLYSSDYGNDVLNGNTPLQLNTWTHVRYTRSGNTWTLYMNGVQDAQTTNSTTLSLGSIIQTIGGVDTSNGCWKGYISDVRVIVGTALSASVPTSPLTAVSGTQLLTNMTNAGIPDSAMINDLETVGNAQVSTSVKKFGTGSISFDGTGDYLKSSADTSLYTFGTGDFTVEFWMYLNNTSSAQVIFDMRPTSTNGVYPDIYFDNSGNTLNWFISSANRITSSSISATTWYHVAVARSGTSTKMFINGTQAGSTYTDTNNYLCGSNRPVVGINATDLSVSAFNGYIDDLRITKGYARYTSNFTAPTAAFPTY